MARENIIATTGKPITTSSISSGTTLLSSEVKSKQLDAFGGGDVFAYGGINGTGKEFKFENLDEVMASNHLFGKSDLDWYNKFNRYGYFDPYSKENVLKEFLFFTKPDLNIFSSESGLSGPLSTVPYFIDVAARNPSALWSLQQTGCPSDKKSPFMNILTNAVKSKLDIPDISSESQNTTANIMGVELTLRGHSYKSDNSYDFTLSFEDTAYLEVYAMVKAYDEYIRRVKTGEHSPHKKYISANIVSEQFSIYKFLIGMDGETILYYAKLTGVYFVGVPRGDFGDPSDFGKYSLSFKSQFVEDNNPLDLREFNRLVLQYIPKDKYELAPTWNGNIGAVDNKWVSLPLVVKANDARAKRRAPGGGNDKYYDYRLMWIK